MSAGSSGNSVHCFKRAQRGLFAGRCRLVGNHVSPSKRHVRRVWLPNVHAQSLWSDILERHVRINTTSSALRQMDRMGGFDNYLLFSRPEKLHSETGLRLRRLLTKRRDYLARVAARGAVAGDTAAGASIADSATGDDGSIAAALAEIEAADAADAPVAVAAAATPTAPQELR